MLRGRRVALLSLLAVLGIVAVIAIPAAPAAPTTQSAKPAKLTVGVAVLRFSTNGKTLKAKGVVTATLIDQAGNKQLVRTPVALTAQAGGHCRILTLVLNKLHLSLLGLNVDLSKVNLTITGAPNGGPLGSLFCSLAKAHLASAKASAVRKLNASLRHGGQNVVRYTTYISPKTAAAPATTCPVLDLILGPLHLNLLGLIVDLNQVHLTITATQGGGALGDLFCSLAH